jgi:hypothetical protein
VIDSNDLLVFFCIFYVVIGTVYALYLMDEEYTDSDEAVVRGMFWLPAFLMALPRLIGQTVRFLASGLRKMLKRRS